MSISLSQQSLMTIRYKEDVVKEDVVNADEFPALAVALAVTLADDDECWMIEYVSFLVHQFLFLLYCE